MGEQGGFVLKDLTGQKQRHICGQGLKNIKHWKSRARWRELDREDSMEGKKGKWPLEMILDKDGVGLNGRKGQKGQSETDTQKPGGFHWGDGKSSQPV